MGIELVLRINRNITVKFQGVAFRIFRSQNSFFVLMLSLVGRDRRDIGERVCCVAMCCYESSSADGQFLGRR